MSILIRPDDIPQTLAMIKSRWSDMTPSQSFDYYFLDDHFDGLYKAEEKVGQLFSAFASLAVLVACLGLFGLASFTAEQRTKEIGIRKVLGARIHHIIALLTKEFSRWILLANFIAWPIAYLAMNRWLQNFAYHISIGLWTFLLAAFMTFFVASVTVSYQTLRSAAANPVDSLKHE
ncbi:MAG: FtsX-like permease family protein [Candidatus Aminicenantales bacterium]